MSWLTPLPSPARDCREPTQAASLPLIPTRSSPFPPRERGHSLKSVPTFVWACLNPAKYPRRHRYFPSTRPLLQQTHSHGAFSSLSLFFFFSCPHLSDISLLPFAFHCSLSLASSVTSPSSILVLFATNSPISQLVACSSCKHPNILALPAASTR